MRVCLLIPDGVGIRNYLYSDLIKILQQGGNQVVLWHSLDPQMIQIAENRLGVKFDQFPYVHRPNGVAAQLLRESGRYGRIRLNAKTKNNSTILTNWSRASTSFKGKLLNYFAEKIGSRVKSYDRVSLIEEKGFKLLRSSKEYREAKKVLEEMKPDILFCTHQRVYSVTPAIEAAKALNIPTSTAIFSWDNLPKGRLPFRADQYLVWSEYMKNELKDYYPDIEDKTIKVTGSPQFDFYFQKGLILDRKEFADKFDLDIAKEWVCFSGCDTITSPNDPQYLKDVGEALIDQSGIQLIFRPVPVEPLSRYLKVLEEYPEVRLIKPKWEKGDHWGSFFPLFEDIQLLVNLAFHCKVVINMGSTMALDFITYGNVGLYLRYDHYKDVKSNWSVDTIYKFQHFRSMENWKAVGFIYSKSEILTEIKRAIKVPDEVAPDRTKWFDKIVEPKKSESSAQRVADALISLANTQS